MTPHPKQSRAELERQVRELGWWYQHFELPGGVWTGTGREPAYRPETRWKLLEPYLPENLGGATVLDVGGNAGYFSIQMKRRGAGRCVLVEPFREFVAQARFAAEVFGIELEVANEDVHTYCLTTEERFDYVIFLGLFYHLKYPVLVLDRLAEMTRQRLFFQSHLLGGDEHYERKADYARETEDSLVDAPGFPQMKFIENLYNGDPTNWWIPNYNALEPLLRAAGLRLVARPHAQMLVAEPDPARTRGKVVYEKLVFPCYGKPGRAVHPGLQQVDPEVWRKLLRQRDEENQNEP
jgi:tRNA (mo5U34)-methyltransferase